MLLKKALTGLMVILLPVLSYTQTKTYSVGDTISPTLLHYIHAMSGANNNPSLYIINCFSFSCSSSLHSINTNTQLQQQFKQVAFIALTKDSGNAPANCITGDSVISAHFFYQTVPHIIWLSNNGVVKAITSSEQLTKTNISNMLSNTVVSLPLKKDRYYNASQSLLQNLALQNNVQIAYSLFTDAIEGFPGSRAWHKDAATNSTSITAINATVSGLYVLAFKKWFFKPYQLITASNIPAGTYCYELHCNTANDSIVKHLMLQQLQHKFNTTASLQNKQVSWYELVADTLQFITGKPPLQNSLTASEFTKLLQHNSQLPYIETGLANTHLIPQLIATLVKNTHQKISVQQLNHLLQPYGYTIIKKTASKPVIIITTIP